MLCSCMYWKIQIWESEQMYSCQFLSKLFVDSIQTQISNMYVIIFKLIWKFKDIYWNRSVLSDSLWPHGLYLTSCSVHGFIHARVLGWVAISFSRGSSPPRDQTWVSCIARKFFTVWATKETLYNPPRVSHRLKAEE